MEGEFNIDLSIVGTNLPLAQLVSTHAVSVRTRRLRSGLETGLYENTQYQLDINPTEKGISLLISQESNNILFLS